MTKAWLRATSAFYLTAFAAAQAPAQEPAEAERSVAPAAADGEISDQEIVVTGSLLQRSDYQLTSPVDFLRREDLDASAPTTIADFVKDLPYNFGSAFASGRAFGNERGAGTINLRGLGASATLVLINGRRQTQIPDNPDAVTDVNSLVPEIMLERLEILKDGASATYGSDAIAGVVNFITNDNFEGIRIAGRLNHFTYSDKNDYRIEGMVGTPVGDRTHITAAFGFYDQEAINGYAYTTPSQKGTIDDIRFSSPSSSPGEFVVPRRNAAGALIAGAAGRRTNVVDPACGIVPSSIPAVVQNGAPVEVANASLATDCRYQFWGDNGSQSDIRRYQGMVRAVSDITDSIRADFEFGYAYVRSATAYTAGDTLGTSPVIPGHNPGNIFRATNAGGQPLYAVSSGVSAGYSRDGAEVFLPARDSQGRVVLAPNPTDPASGIPFYEDVNFSGRPVNSQCNLPTGNTLAPGDCAHSRPSVATNNIMRVAGGLSGDLGGGWNWRGGLAWSRYQLDTNGTVGVALNNELNFALQGLGGPGCNRAAAVPTPGRNGCEYFNLFGNSAMASPGSPQANSQSVIDYVLPFLRDQYESTLFTGELIVAGELFSLPAGPVGLAVGYQHRRAGLAIDYDAQANLGNKANGITQQDFDEHRSTDAFFLETNIPLVDSSFGYLELTGALRHERIGGDLKTTDPKIGVRFNTPDDLITLRASYGTSFIAPSLYRLFAVSARGTAVNDCPIAQGPPCTGEQNLRIALFENGNLDLRPETSEAWSAGIIVEPMSNLTLEATWWKFSFDDKIATQTASSIILASPNGTPENPVVRDATGRIVSVTARFFNQASVVTEGVDFSVNYVTPFFNVGDLNLNVAGTYNYKYDFQNTPGGPVIHAAGESNDQRTASPNTKLRLNSRATWTYNEHALTVMMRYYAPIDFTLTPGVELDEWMPIDLNYTYTFDLGGTEAQLGVGAMNIFEEDEPFVPFPGFQPFIPSLYDTRGRSVYVKATVTF